MNRIWRIREAIAIQSATQFLPRLWSIPKPIALTIVASSNFSDFRSTREASTRAEPGLKERKTILGIASLFGHELYRMDGAAKEDLKEKVSQLRDDLVRCGSESEEVVKVLEQKGLPLFCSYSDGAPFVELLTQLLPHHHRLALEVFGWRRKFGESGIPMVSEEYAKGITIAGRTENLDLAVEWFTEAMNKRIKSTSMYNALMGAYMWNGLADKCLSVFRDLKSDVGCVPSIVTYNIVISVYGRLMMTDRMEAAFQEAKGLNLCPDLNTYNNLIAGYVTTWKWDGMDEAFRRMQGSPVKPDLKTYFLMLRGYAHSGNLEKMEAMYELVKHRIEDIDLDPPVIRAMICAYIKSYRTDRIERINALMKLIPEEEYRPWLNVLLINVFAKENCLEGMEDSINEAFEHHTHIHKTRVMRSIVATYFRCNAVDRLSDFVSRAESAGWKTCRSLYHGMLLMYGKHGYLEKMENTLKQMENANLMLTCKTYWILFNAYLTWGETYKAMKIIGLMYKNGYRIPLNLPVP